MRDKYACGDRPSLAAAASVHFSNVLVQIAKTTPASLVEPLCLGRDRAVKPCSSVRISLRDHSSLFDELIEKH